MPTASTPQSLQPLQPTTQPPVTQFDYLNAARTLPRVIFEAGQIAKSLDFDYWSYGQASYLHFSKPVNLMLGNLPREWQSMYQSKNYAAIDPVIQYGLHTSKPLVWSEALFEKTPAYWEDALTFGLDVGWSQSARDANTTTVGVFSLIRKQKEISPDELSSKQCAMHWLAHTLHHKVTRLQNKPIELTPREVSVMRWTADGKSANEIADIMSIKERTVTFHINNVVVRLGVQNKTAAAVRLAMSGLLF